VSNPDPLSPWNAEPAPVLRLRDYLTRADRFCADCLKAGARCPDHQQDSAPEPGHPLTEGLAS
jgi:hypothetical protein